MSGPKVATFSPPEVTLEQYRAAAQLEAERAAAERLKRNARLVVMRSRLQALHQEHHQLQRRLDVERTKLADLSYVPPDLPSMPESDDPADWDFHLNQCESVLLHARADAERAVEVAQTQALERAATRHAWTQHHDLLAQQATLKQRAQALSKTSGLSLPHVTAITTASADSARPVIEQLNSQLKDGIQTLEEFTRQCVSLIQANTALEQLIGDHLMRQSIATSEAALHRWHEERKSETAQRFETELDQFLLKNDLLESKLPNDLRDLLAGIRLGQDLPASCDLWVRLMRHRHQLDSVTEASRMLNTPPPAIDDDILRSWQTVSSSLESVINARSELSPELKAEFASIHQLAKQRLAERHARVALAAALREAGIQEVAREDILFEDDEDDDKDALYFGLRGFEQRRVSVQIGQGKVLWVPFRTNNQVDSANLVRDREFDRAVCSRLSQAVLSLQQEGDLRLSAFKALASADEHTVLTSGQMEEHMGVRIRPSATSNKSLKEAERRLPDPN